MITKTILTLGIMASFVIGISFSSVYAGTLIDTDDIADDAITTEKIKNKTIKNADMRNNQIKSSKIRDGTITSEDLAPELVTAIEDANLNQIQTYITVSHVAGFDKFRCTSTADYTLDIYMTYQPGASYVMTLKDGVTSFSYGVTHSDHGVDGFTIGGLAGLDQLIDLSGTASPVVGYITLRTDPSATSSCTDE